MILRLCHFLGITHPVEKKSTRNDGTKTEYTTNMWNSRDVPFCEQCHPFKKMSLREDNFTSMTQHSLVQLYTMCVFLLGTDPMARFFYKKIVPLREY